MSTIKFVDNISALKQDMYNTEMGSEQECFQCGQYIYSEGTYDKEEVDKLVEEYGLVVTHLKKTT